MLVHCLLLACVLQEALAWTISCSWSRPAVRREARSAAQDLSACAHSAMSRRAALAVSLSFALAPLPTCAESPGSKPDPFAEFNIMGVAGRKAEETIKASAARQASEMQSAQEAEAAALDRTEIGQLLKKRTADNKSKNEASIREQYCIRNCKFENVFRGNRAPQNNKELYCEECRLEFGVIPGDEQYLKEPGQ